MKYQSVIARRLRLGLFGCLLSLTAGIGAGCEEAPKKPAPPSVQPVLVTVAPGAYSDGAVGLQKLWTTLLTAARKEQPEKVINLLGSMTLTKAELVGLLGETPANEHWPRYQAMMSELTHLGGLELVAQIQQRHFDEVVVLPLNDQPPAELTATERKVKHAVVAATPIYSVRLKAKAEPRGIRYEFFVYLDGRWRTGNLLGQVLPAAPETPAPTPPPVAPKETGANK